MFASIPCNRRNRPLYCPLTLLNGQTLRRGLRHRHAAGDLQSVRVVGHRRVLIASFKAGVGNLLDRRRAITPFGVHLQITAVLVDGGASEGGIRQDPPHLRAAQEVPTQVTPPLNIGAPLALLDGLFDGRRSAGLENLADHARRPRPDAWNARQRTVGTSQVGEWRVQRENGVGRALVAEHLLLRRLRERQIAKIPPTTAFTSAYVRGASTAMVQGCSQSASGSGASAGPEMTSPLGLKRDP